MKFYLRVPFVSYNNQQHRFVLVVSGVTAAFLFSFLPPSKTIRSYQRATLSTTSCQIGSIYCCIITFANCRHQEARDSASLNRSLLAIRGKLKRSIIAATNVGYEVRFLCTAENQSGERNLPLVLTEGEVAKGAI